MSSEREANSQAKIKYRLISALVSLAICVPVFIGGGIYKIYAQKQYELSRQELVNTFRPVATQFDLQQEHIVAFRSWLQNSNVLEKDINTESFQHVSSQGILRLDLQHLLAAELAEDDQSSPFGPYVCGKCNLNEFVSVSEVAAECEMDQKELPGHLASRLDNWHWKEGAGANSWDYLLSPRAILHGNIQVGSGAREKYFTALVQLSPPKVLCNFVGYSQEDANDRFIGLR